MANDQWQQALMSRGWGGQQNQAPQQAGGVMQRNFAPAGGGGWLSSGAGASPQQARPPATWQQGVMPQGPQASMGQPQRAQGPQVRPMEQFGNPMMRNALRGYGGF